MVEFTTQFCDSASFCQTALRQYGRYEKDADTKQLPFLNEHTVIAYITAKHQTSEFSHPGETRSTGVSHSVWTPA